MPVKIPDNLPAVELLKQEHIFVMTDLRANSQDIRPLRILILNLMPIKVTTETDFVRLLSNNPLQVELEFLRLESHTPKNTPMEHLEQFYKGFSEVKDNCYDGMIVTGAPVELLPFEEVGYWKEVGSLFDWARTHVTSTIYICWAAQAALYHFYGVDKDPLPQKLFGVFRHRVQENNHPLFRGFDDEFYIPHSRHTALRASDLTRLGQDEVQLLSASEEAGEAILSSRGGREFYLTGHSEYPLLTLHEEYIRDLEKGLAIDPPLHYYQDNDPDKDPVMRWAGHAHLLFNNWLNYYVYQETPFDITKIRNLSVIQKNG